MVRVAQGPGIVQLMEPNPCIVEGPPTARREQHSVRPPKTRHRASEKRPGLEGNRPWPPHSLTSPGLPHTLCEPEAKAAPSIGL